MVFYDAQSWKIYNEARTRGTLYLYEERIRLADTYEDYFLLDNGKIAVRKEDRVGLMDDRGNVLFSPQYEQVESLSENRYRCLEKGKWYMADERGKKLNATGFDYLFATESEVFVHLEQQVGVLSFDGAFILRPLYDDVHGTDGFYILDQNRKLAVADVGGKLLSDFSFISYRWWSDVLIMYEAPAKMVVFSRKGNLNTVPCQLLIYGAQTAKCYSGSDLESLCWTIP